MAATADPDRGARAPSATGNLRRSSIVEGPRRYFEGASDALVEVEGDLEGDIEDGAIRIERKDKWTEIRVKSEGRDLEARVPHSSIVSWPSRDKREAKVLVRKVDVDHVRMLAASCQP